MTWWSVVRFPHVLFAALWVGGQLTVSLVVLPLARRLLDEGRRARGERPGRISSAAGPSRSAGDTGPIGRAQGDFGPSRRHGPPRDLWYMPAVTSAP